MIPALITAAGALGSTILGGILSNKSNKDAINLQFDQQKELMNLQSQKNWDLYERAFNKESSYNTPYNQIQRLIKAGVNPYVGMQSNVGTSETSLSAPTVSQGSAPSPIPMQNVLASVPSAIAQIAGAFASVQQGRKTGVETDVALATKEDLIRKLGFEADNEEAQQVLNGLDIAAKSLYQIPQMRATLNETYERITNMQVERGNVSADTILKQTQSALNESLKGLNDVQKQQAEQAMPLYLEQLKQTIGLIRRQQETEVTKQFLNSASANQAGAAAAQSYAMAGLAVSQQKYQDVLNSYAPLLQSLQVTSQQLQNKKTRQETAKIISEWYTNFKTVIPKIESLYLGNSFMRAQIDLYKEQIIKAMKDNNYYELRMMVDQVSQMMNAISGNASVIPKLAK